MDFTNALIYYVLIMGDIFFRALKTSLLLISIVAGIAFIYMTQEHGIKPSMFIVLSLGLGFVFSKPFRSLPTYSMVSIIVVTLALGFLSKYLPMLMFMAANEFMGMEYYLDMNFFIIWCLLLLMPGLPLLMFVFAKFGD